MVTPILNPCDFEAPTPCTENPSFTYTRYPCDFDDPRTGNTRGLPLIVDLQTPVRAEVVNRQREAILAIESELGIQPSGTFATVRARLDTYDALLCSIWNTILTSGNPIDIQENGVSIVNPVISINFLGNVSVEADGTRANVTVFGGDGYQPIHEALAVTTPGQTVFALSQSAWNNDILLFIEGIKQEIGDYTVNSNQFTWNGTQSLYTTDIIEVLYFTRSGGGVIAESMDTYTVMNQDIFTATASQTIFSLSAAPINQSSTELFIAGVSRTVGVDYTLSGSTVTYIGSPSLSGGEIVVIKYLVLN